MLRLIRVVVTVLFPSSIIHALSVVSELGMGILMLTSTSSSPWFFSSRFTTFREAQSGAAS
jgi:hypothetical protein